MTRPVRLGSRGSRLALWQANYVANLLRPVVGARPVEIVTIQTTGDQVGDVPLPQIGGEGVFTREIQRALLAGSVDVAVHSLKDLPTQPVEGLTLAAVPSRGPTGDVFVSQSHKSFDALPKNATVATSSLRRRAQALHRRPDLCVVDMRGNVETRLRKLAERKLDGLILAKAGLDRLGLSHVITEMLDPAWMFPAVGQGALGLECRINDAATLAFVRQLNDWTTQQAVLAERAFLRAMGGGCQVPMGATATIVGNTLTLRAAVLRPDGSERLVGEHTGTAGQAEAIGQQLAVDLLARGACKFLENGPVAPG